MTAAPPAAAGGAAPMSSIAVLLATLPTLPRVDPPILIPAMETGIRNNLERHGVKAFAAPRVAAISTRSAMPSSAPTRA